MNIFNIIRNLTFFLLACQVSSCDLLNPVPKDVEIAIEQAGHNQKELLKVISHYKNDPNLYKLKAAFFLIRNMPGLLALDSMSVSENQKYFDPLDLAFKKTQMKLNLHLISLTIDSINKKHQITPKRPQPRYLKDIETITSDFLIKNIDQAFYVWETMPWAKNISFEDFCEYILPYRCTDTYIKDARSFFISKFKDSLQNCGNAFQAGQIITTDINRWFLNNTMIFKPYPYLLPIEFKNLLKGRIGECKDQNALFTAALRSLGVPTAFDEIPNWGNQANKHFWFKIIDKRNDTITKLITNENLRRNTNHIVTGSTFHFFPVIAGIPNDVILHYTKTIPKVYRQSFSIQKNSLSEINTSQKEIPDYFLNPRLQDVTNEYIECADVKIRLNKAYDQKYAYLCVFDNKKWTPVSWGEINNSSVLFKNMGKNIVYLPAYFEFGEIIPAGNPFLLKLDGKIEEIVPRVEKEAIKIQLKYPYRMIVHQWQSQMIGASFKVANRSDLSDTINIADIKNISFYRGDIKVNLDQKFRYLIFSFPNTGTSLTELKVFGTNSKGEEIPLKGKLIGAKGKFPQIVENIIDDNPLTYFITDTTEKVNYIGIDFGKKNLKKITKIKFIPRGDENAIIYGEKYELFYWDDKWVSLGIKTGELSNKLTFNVPKNSLLLVKDLIGGTENRIFTYKNNKQIFW